MTLDLLRGWNERSFPGWAAWWTRLAGVGLMVAAFQALFSTTPFSLYLVTGWTLAAAVLVLAVGRCLSWLANVPPKAALAGLLRFAPALVFVPLLDALVLALITRSDGAVWWVAPSGFFMRFLLAGCDPTACLSPGLSVFSLALAVLVGALLVKLGAKYGKAIGGAVLVYILFWLAVSVPAFTAWTRLSTYGATLASPNQVVEQAFNRTWATSVWGSARPLFWTSPSIGNQGTRTLVGSVLLWLGCFGLLAPFLRRPDLSRGSWLSRVSAGTFVLPPVLLGALLGFMSRSGSAWITGLIGGLFAVSVAIVGWRTLMATDQGETDDEQAVLMRILALVGAWLLGWPVLGGFVLALLVRRLVGKEAVWKRTLVLAGSAWFLAVAALAWALRTDWSVLPHDVLLGLFCLLAGLAFWQEGAQPLLSGGPAERLSGSGGPVLSRPVVFGALLAALLLFWAISLPLALIWLVGVLAVVSAAILWLFPQKPVNAALFVWFSLILAGIVLPSFSSFIGQVRI